MDTESVQHVELPTEDVAGNPGDVPASDGKTKTGLASRAKSESKSRLLDGHKSQNSEKSEFVRAENEDDDGYAPYSDRRPEQEPLFEQDPWA